MFSGLPFHGAARAQMELLDTSMCVGGHVHRQQHVGAIQLALESAVVLDDGVLRFGDLVFRGDTRR